MSIKQKITTMHSCGHAVEHDEIKPVGVRVQPIRHDNRVCFDCEQQSPAQRPRYNWSAVQVAKAQKKLAVRRQTILLAQQDILTEAGGALSALDLAPRLIERLELHYLDAKMLCIQLGWDVNRIITLETCLTADGTGIR